jgi:hypothetical protein
MSAEEDTMGTIPEEENEEDGGKQPATHVYTLNI